MYIARSQIGSSEHCRPPHCRPPPCGPVRVCTLQDPKSVAGSIVDPRTVDPFYVDPLPPVLFRVHCRQSVILFMTETQWTALEALDQHSTSKCSTKLRPTAKSLQTCPSPHEKDSYEQDCLYRDTPAQNEAAKTTFKQSEDAGL